MTVRIANRNAGLVRPNWHVVVNQFECPLGIGRSLKMDESETEEATPMNQTFPGLKPLLRTPRTIVSDWLAPSNCLQYHPEETGTIESFNFGNGMGKLKEYYYLFNFFNMFEHF